MSITNSAQKMASMAFFVACSSQSQRVEKLFKMSGIIFYLVSKEKYNEGKKKYYEISVFSSHCLCHVIGLFSARQHRQCG